MTTWAVNISSPSLPVHFQEHAFRFALNAGRSPEQHARSRAIILGEYRQGHIGQQNHLLGRHIA